MTQKEKLEQARKLYQTANADQKYVLEKLFPELVESEDEKIRKELLSVVNDLVLPDEQQSRFVAWLEKQSTPQVRTGLEWVNTIDDACDKRYSEEYAHGEYCHEQSFKWGFQEGVDWVKSLKERVLPQPKQEWSEEDERKISLLDALCDDQISKSSSSSTMYREMDELKEWLKSLKHQKQWKPSEEQMEALHDLNLTGNISYAGQGQVLIELYNDLKKLKG